MCLDRKERVSGAGAFYNPLLVPRPLGIHGAARGEGQGDAGEVRRRKRSKERCIDSERMEAVA
jgi:hypothetical protein